MGQAGWWVDWSWLRPLQSKERGCWAFSVEGGPWPSNPPTAAIVLPGRSPLFDKTFCRLSRTSGTGTLPNQCEEYPAVMRFSRSASRHGLQGPPSGPIIQAAALVGGCQPETAGCCEIPGCQDSKELMRRSGNEGVTVRIRPAGIRWIGLLSQAGIFDRCIDARSSLWSVRFGFTIGPAQAGTPRQEMAGWPLDSRLLGLSNRWRLVGRIRVGWPLRRAAETY